MVADAEFSEHCGGNTDSLSPGEAVAGPANSAAF